MSAHEQPSDATITNPVFQVMIDKVEGMEKKLLDMNVPKEAFVYYLRNSVPKKETWDLDTMGVWGQDKKFIEEIRMQNPETEYDYGVLDGRDIMHMRRELRGMTDADPKSWREHVTNIKKTWVKHP
jgi:hypothetical protein